MSDPTEGVRRALVSGINSNPLEREDLEEMYGKGNVFSTEEVREKFEVLSFMAPFVVVEVKESGSRGTLTFQHSPRIYFDLKED